MYLSNRRFIFVGLSDKYQQVMIYKPLSIHKSTTSASASLCLTYTLPVFELSSYL